MIKVKKIRRREDSHKHVKGKYSNWPMSERVKKPKKNLEPVEYIETASFLKCEKLLTERLFRHYQINSKHAKPLFSRLQFERTLKLFFKLLKTKIVYNEAGVFLKNFGYFCIIRHPKVGVHRRRTEGTYFMNLHTKGHLFTPSFLPIRKDAALQEWTMDRAFSPRNIIKPMSRILREGKKYKLAYTYLQNLYGNNGRKTLTVKNDNRANNSGDSHGL